MRTIHTPTGLVEFITYTGSVPRPPGDGGGEESTDGDDQDDELKVGTHITQTSDLFKHFQRDDDGSPTLFSFNKLSVNSPFNSTFY
jgi:hypothetical protein